MTPKLKILISAYACSPYQGSEPGVGWGFVAELAKHHELWVIVEEEKFRAEVERYIAENPEFSQAVHFFFILKQRHRRLRKLWPPSYYWYYRRWHEDALTLAYRLHEEVGFDLVHQLTMVGFREPGYLWKLGAPFVWGPVGGMGLFPWRFISSAGLYGALYYFGYNIYNIIQMRFLARPRRAARLAKSGLIAINSENMRGLLRNYGAVSRVLVAVGPPKQMSDEILVRRANEPLRVVWVGQLKSGKALNLALEALARVPSSLKWELHIIGGGSLREKWARQASSLGIAEKCQFYGRIVRSEVLSVMRRSHVHLLTSLREGTPSVIVEAGAMSLPTICLDCSGMSDMVDDTNGLKVPVTSPAKVIAGIASYIEQLANDESLRQRLAKNAFEQAKRYGWDKKVLVLNEIYSDRIKQHGIE